ncbi:MAG: PVC-type heme-binding CxxCH protein, partial [Pirellulales bacterium]
MNHIPTMSLLFCLSFVAQVAAEPFELKDGDRVVLLGSEFVAQQMRHNYFEAALATTWPDRRVTVRNLGWSGDTPSMASRGYFEHAKQEGWNRTVAELTRLKPTVVFLFYGSNSPFGTEGQKAQFLTEMNRLVTEVQKLTSRIVIVSPPPARESPLSLPAPPDLNADREAVAAALEEFATERELRFVDLFKPLQTTMASAKAPRMYDALRYNAAGYRAAADVLLKSLAVKPPKLDANRSAELRQLIARKNELYFRRYRPQNETYLRGFRKHEQGRNAKEIIEFDALIAQAESRIAAFVEGKPLPPAMKEPDPIKLAFTAMTPEQQLKQMTVAERFELSLFAAEPMVANPIHMQFDARGRLWVATSPIYPHIKPGAKPRDEIVILEDTDGDGRADKRTVFADDLLIPTAVLPDERGGAFVANSTEILHLSDTDGDGRADQRRMVLSGFGSEDTHHILHTFRWGPDAAFYFNQSIYIHTHMETPYGVRRLMGSGIWRYRPETGHAEIMMRGLVNPWGHVFDEWGQSFATDGAGGDGINYIFPHSVHVTAVGFSRNLRGLNPGQPKHCGLEVIQSRHFPDDWQGALITSDFRGNRINSFRLSEQGSGYGSRQSQDLVTSKHGAFRPVDMKIGPDGALYIADWYNPIIQHGEVDFRDARRDYKHGRIWRLTAKDRPLLKKPKLADATVPELLEHLKAPEHWTRRRAKVQLTLRDRTEVVAALKQWTAELDPANPNFEHDRLEALWASQAVYH